MLAIVDGLGEEAWHHSVVPTGWSVAGMLEHLGNAEWHWFRGVVAGKQPERPRDVDDDQPAYDPIQCSRRTLHPRTSPASTATNVRSPNWCWLQLHCRRLRAANTGWTGLEPPNVRWVVLHMSEETARHIGHLDIARELLDGRVRLGGR
ncbi:MAG: DUF664 domain-containing protein [Candidatus Dormibacteria bacterium]